MRDIEQLVSMGRELKACPYYGVRYSLPSAQVSHDSHVVLNLSDYQILEFPQIKLIVSCSSW